MSEADASNLAGALQRIRLQALHERLLITRHAHQEMVDEEITMDQLREAILGAQILENYPRHRQGPCCLLCAVPRDLGDK